MAAEAAAVGGAVAGSVVVAWAVVVAAGILLAAAVGSPVSAVDIRPWSVGNRPVQVDAHLGAVGIRLGAAGIRPVAVDARLVPGYCCWGTRAAVTVAGSRVAGMLFGMVADLAVRLSLDSGSQAGE